MKGEGWLCVVAIGWAVFVGVCMWFGYLADCKDKRQENERKQKEALASQPLCGDRHERGYICTLPEGHSGGHEARCLPDLPIVAAWPQEKGGE